VEGILRMKRSLGYIAAGVAVWCAWKAYRFVMYPLYMPRRGMWI